MREGEVFEAVLRVVMGIPFGATMTYGEVAERAGNRNWAQSVGRQLDRAVVLQWRVPWWRVTAADGDGEISTPPSDGQRQLLEAEQRAVRLEAKLDAIIARLDQP